MCISLLQSILRPLAFTTASLGLCISLTLASSDRGEVPPILNHFSQTTSIAMTATSTDTESIDTYAIRDDGSFGVEQYAKVFFDQLTETLTPEQTWTNTPTHYVYFDGKRTLYSAYGPMPVSIYEKTLAKEDVPLGDSVHLRPALWPLLNDLIPMGTWESDSNNQHTLFIKHLSLHIHFDQFGRILKTQHTTKTLSQTHSYNGYDSNGKNRFPTKMTRSLRVTDKKGKSLLDETTHYDLRIVENPDNIEDLLSFEPIAQRANRRDQFTGDVFSPQNELLYNQYEVEEAYLRGVGLRNPTRTRNILFIVIGTLSIISLIAWKRRAT